MKTTKELNELSNAIGQAICAYHKAVFENLKESGKEYKLYPTDDDDKGIYLEDDGMMSLIDKVRYTKHESGVELIECHCCEYGYKKTDEWYDADVWGDDVDYIYNSIIWDDEEV